MKNSRHILCCRLFFLQVWKSDLIIPLDEFMKPRQKFPWEQHFITALIFQA